MAGIGENIRKCRLAMELSQADAAKMLNISTPAFCKIETGQTDLNISRLLQIATLFKVPAAELITGTMAGDSTSDVSELQRQLEDKEEELNKLRKKVIELYDKLGM